MVLLFPFSNSEQLYFPKFSQSYFDKKIAQISELHLGPIPEYKISDYNLSEMRKNMSEVDQEEFDRFVERIWGTKIKQPLDYISENSEPEVARRGRPRKS